MIVQGNALSLPSSQTWAELSCGHRVLWDDPDEDVNGSFWCGDCGGWFGVRRFV